MKSRYAMLMLIVIVALLLVVAVVVRPRLAQTTLIDGDNMGIVQTYQLDTTIDDSVFIVAEQVDLLAGSHITGDAAFVSSDVSLEGRVDGDLTVTGDNVVLHPHAFVGGHITLIAEQARIDGVVNGDITFSGKQLLIAPGATLSGSVSLCSGDILEQRDGASTRVKPCADLNVVELVESLRSNLLLQSTSTTTDWGSRTVFALLGTVFTAFLLSAVSTLGITLFPVHIATMKHALTRPQAVIVTGIMTALLCVGVAAALVVLLALVPVLAVVLVPLGLIAAVIMLALAAAGTIPLTLLLGEWLLGRVSSASYPPLFTSLLGSLVVVMVVTVPVFVPSGVALSLALAALVGVLAAGLAISTRLGNRAQRKNVLARA